MTININLSDVSIARAISELQTIKDNIDYGLEQTVEILAKEGAMLASGDYGSMANVTDVSDSKTTSRILVTGEAAVIAEFGAGDATMEVMFENYPGVDVFPGSYSEQVGSGEYAETGRWHFGGNVYTEVEPRAGLLDAKMFIVSNGTEIAREVIKL